MTAAASTLTDARPTATPAGEVTLVAKRRFLVSPPAWSDAPGPIETIETHMSCVFLGPDHVLKLKKPIRTAYLDFSTLARREWNCREEVRLNRRLAPHVYLGVVALVAHAGGSLALVDERSVPAGARIVDWLVSMRRLPAEHMLDRAIARAAVTSGDIDRVADRLTAFYLGLPPEDIAPETFVARFAREQRYSRDVLSRAELALDGGPAMCALDRVDRALGALRPELTARAAGGRVIEGHGDLRPEHVCLNAPPVVIDCLEFDRSLRLVDPFEEIEFLGLECALTGAAWIGERLRKRCAAALGTPAPELLRFYTAHRALVRARLALAHLLEPEPRDGGKWAPLAHRYVGAALAAVGGLGA